MYIIMLGAQGTGKGTVAGLISKKTGYPQISTGDIFRENISQKTDLGIEAEKYISEGNLVPDCITVPMIINRLNEEDAIKGAILDGFPRTIEQAKKLDEILALSGKKVDLVINLTSPREELIERMLTRRVCPKCKATYNTKLHPPKADGICDNCGEKLIQRADDSNPEAINRRLEIYEGKTSALVEHYSNKGVLRTENISVSTGRMGAEVANDIVSDIKM